MRLSIARGFTSFLLMVLPLCAQIDNGNITGRVTDPRTANHQKAIGAFSRHARIKAVPPSDPLPLQDAELLIREILVSWIKELASADREMAGDT